MGTEVLRPQDCLIKSTPVVFHRRKSVNRKIKSDGYDDLRSKKSHKTKRNTTTTANNNNSNTFILGQVTILKRGESLNKIRSGSDVAVYGTGRLGPDPKLVPKQVRISLPDIYAGSAFSMSPSPSSLPLPSFFNKKAEADDSATRDLRRLLRLD